MKFFKFVVLLALVASAASLAGNWFLYHRYQAEILSKTEMESRMIQLEEQNQSFEKQAAQVAQYNEELERLREQLKGYVGQRDKIKTELDNAFGEIAKLKKQIQTLESGKKTLEDQLYEGQMTDTAVAREAEKIANLPPTPVLIEEPYPGTTETGPEPTFEPKKAEPKKTEVKQQAPPAAPPAKAPASKPAPVPAAKPPAPKKEAPFAPLPTSEVAVDQRPLQVLSVNRQFKFVVINGGIRGSLKIGDALRVEQNGKLIGRIQVEKLYENFSACNILEEIAPAQIREGDLVRPA